MNKTIQSHILSLRSIRNAVVSLIELSPSNETFDSFDEVNSIIRKNSNIILNIALEIALHQLINNVHKFSNTYKFDASKKDLDVYRETTEWKNIVGFGQNVLELYDNYLESLGIRTALEN